MIAMGIRTERVTDSILLHLLAVGVIIINCTIRIDDFSWLLIKR